MSGNHCGCFNERWLNSAQAAGTLDLSFKYLNIDTRSSLVFESRDSQARPISDLVVEVCWINVMLHLSTQGGHGGGDRGIRG